MDNVQFRKDFPEFSDTARYPDSQLNFWSGVATKMIRPCAWQDMTSTAIELYTAHELALAQPNIRVASAGGIPGTSGTGITQSKTVGSTSITYDTVSGVEKNAGWYNLTIYGRQLYRLMRLFGAGATQL